MSKRNSFVGCPLSTLRVTILIISRRGINKLEIGYSGERSSTDGLKPQRQVYYGVGVLVCIIIKSRGHKLIEITAGIGKSVIA